MRTVVQVHVKETLDTGEVIQRRFQKVLLHHFPETPLPGDLLLLREADVKPVPWELEDDLYLLRLLVLRREWSTTNGVVLVCEPWPFESDISGTAEIMVTIQSMGFDKLPTVTLNRD